MKGCRTIKPSNERSKVLKQINEGRLGISKGIEEIVKNCTSCIKVASNRREPLMPSEFPERP